MEGKEVRKSMIPVRANKSTPCGNQRAYKPKRKTYTEIRQRLQEQALPNSFFGMISDPALKVVYRSRPMTGVPCGDSWSMETIHELPEEQNGDPASVPFAALEGNVIHTDSESEEIKMIDLEIQEHAPLKMPSFGCATEYNTAEEDFGANTLDTDEESGGFEYDPASDLGAVPLSTVEYPSYQGAMHWPKEALKPSVLDLYLKDHDYTVFDAIVMSSDRKDKLTRKCLNRKNHTLASRRWLSYVAKEMDDQIANLEGKLRTATNRADHFLKLLFLLIRLGATPLVWIVALFHALMSQPEPVIPEEQHWLSDVIGMEFLFNSQ